MRPIMFMGDWEQQKGAIRASISSWQLRMDSVRVMTRQDFDRLVACRDELELSRHIAQSALSRFPADQKALPLWNFLQGICRLLRRVQQRLDADLAAEGIAASA